MEELEVIDIGATELVKGIFDCEVEDDDRDEILKNLFVDYHNPDNPSNFSFCIVEGFLFVGFVTNSGDFIVSTMNEMVDRISEMAVDVSNIPECPDCGERHG